MSSESQLSIEKDDKKVLGATEEVSDASESSSLPETNDRTHRSLKNRHIQLIGIGGTIGTALFVQIGAALTKGGPGSLFTAFTLWCTFVLAINNCLSEMVTWMPITAPFARFADQFVDPALGFCAGINFFVFQTIMIPFEVTAFNVIMHFWTDKVPLPAIIVFMVVSYVLLSTFTVKYYGESEFWLSLGKALLAAGLIVFTFIVMLGGNPLHDRFGFRHWNPSKIEGTPFAEYIEEGNLGRFMGFVACLTAASFTIAGPDYVAITAGEAQLPRKTLPQAFRGVSIRLTTFFVLGSLCVGILVPYNDPDLLGALSEARAGAGSSPYVIAMQRLKIPVLPHIVNALLLTTVFSAGNGYVYTSSRMLFGLALEGKAPRRLLYCTKNGIPIYCVAISLMGALLSFLQLSNNSAVVLGWFVNMVTASQLINFAIICITYLRFHKALKVQGIDRKTLPHRSFWQPFCGWYALTGTVVMAFVQGYTLFLPGRWDTATFFFSYTMLGVVPILFVYYKIRHRTKFADLATVTFFRNERAQVDRYEEEFESKKA
ncbi:general amino acid permease AGP2 [Coprinopsis sp. MPI-PUGE-AT-0042]|nr:general amino acid permease AGP2 [Coprinopsis sp. MPI-PUGE-AT-0042]